MDEEERARILSPEDRKYLQSVQKWLNITIANNGEVNNSGFTPKQLSNAFMAADDKVDAYFTEHGFYTAEEAQNIGNQALNLRKAMFVELIKEGVRGFNNFCEKQIAEFSNDAHYVLFTEIIHHTFDAIATELGLSAAIHTEIDAHYDSTREDEHVGIILPEISREERIQEHTDEADKWVTTAINVLGNKNNKYAPSVLKEAVFNAFQALDKALDEYDFSHDRLYARAYDVTSGVLKDALDMLVAEGVSSFKERYYDALAEHSNMIGASVISASVRAFANTLGINTSLRPDLTLRHRKKMSDAYSRGLDTVQFSRSAELGHRRHRTFKRGNNALQPKSLPSELVGINTNTEPLNHESLRKFIQRCIGVNGQNNSGFSDEQLESAFIKASGNLDRYLDKKGFASPEEAEIVCNVAFEMLGFMVTTLVSQGFAGFKNSYRDPLVGFADRSVYTPLLEITTLLANSLAENLGINLKQDSQLTPRSHRPHAIRARRLPVSTKIVNLLTPEEMMEDCSRSADKCVETSIKNLGNKSGFEPPRLKEALTHAYLMLDEQFSRQTSIPEDSVDVAYENVAESIATGVERLVVAGEGGLRSFYFNMLKEYGDTPEFGVFSKAIHTFADDLEISLRLRPDLPKTSHRRHVDYTDKSPITGGKSHR